MAVKPATITRLKIIIGIDPGVHTGVSVYDVQTKVMDLRTLDFWKTYHLCKQFRQDETVFIIEDPNAISNTFRSSYQRKTRMAHANQFRKSGTLFPGADPVLNEKQFDRISQNVGSNKRDAQLLIEGFESNEFNVIKYIPQAHNKLTPKEFEQLCQRDGITIVSGSSIQQHARDAGAFILRRRVELMAKYNHK